MTLGVVVVTYERPWHLQRCLERLRSSHQTVAEIVVVDGSPERTAEASAELHGARYLTNPNGYGHMTESRNIGWRTCSSEIVAFIDDDAFVEPGWAEHVCHAFLDPAVGGMGGRAIQNPMQEPVLPAPEIGKIRPDGSLVANFESPGDSPIDVQHVIGCNMAFRRSILEDLGGFRADYPGTSLREETDLCLQVLAAGWVLRFDPQAVVIHVGAPHARGARFDLRYQYYAHRNQTQLIVRNTGVGPMFRGHLGTTAEAVMRRLSRDTAGTVLRPLIALAGTGSGFMAGLAARRSDRRRGTQNRMSGPALEQLLTCHHADEGLEHVGVVRAPASVEGLSAKS